MSVTSAVLHLYSLHFWYPLKMWILGHLLPCWVCVCWCSYQLSIHLCLQCDCDRMTSLLYKDLVQSSIHSSYCCMHSIVHCSLCDRVVTSLLIIAINGLWSVITLTSFAKQQWWSFSRPCIMPKASHSMLLHHCFILDKLLLVNTMGHNVVLFGTSSSPEFMPSLTCKRLAPRLIPDATISRYRGFGGGMVISAYISLESRVTTDCSITSLKNGMLIHQNKHLFLLSFKFACYISQDLAEGSIMVSAHVMEPCNKNVIGNATFSPPRKAHLFFSEKLSPVSATQNGRHMYPYLPKGHGIVVMYDKSSSILKLWYLELESMRIMFLTPTNQGKMSLQLGPLWIGLIRSLLNCNGSKHSPTLLLTFGPAQNC